MTDPFAQHLAAELEAERDLRLKSERRIGELMAENEVLCRTLRKVFERLCQDSYSQQDDPLLLISEVLSGG